MYTFLSTGQARTLAILLIIVLICNIQVDGKTSARKPPFNGSIFGKRSNLPVVNPLSSPISNNGITSHQSSKRNIHILSGLLLQQQLAQQQQDSSLQAAIKQCLSQNDAADLEVMELCEDLIALALGYQEPSNGGLAWI